MNELFDDTGLTRLPMEDAEVYLRRGVPWGCSDQALLTSLVDSTEWRQDEITLFGKRHRQPRLIAWYGDKGISYTYSGLTLEARVWSGVLTDLKQRVETLSGHQFNSVLLNYYRDQHDSMGMHSDDEPELGDRPVIASISIGEQRTLVFKHKRRNDIKAIKLPLPSGSLLLMKGDTQRNWKHGVNKERKPCGPRVNLTFRNIQPSRKK